ncbi:BRO-N domain-containing protein [Halalkalibacter alkalisediminis]|uniref:Bro-N domain-containing protein n=1 Tax=Halalkalibacter alkalisediminis TaxID=935616 RepID=A0ABV6NFW0_9BACI|nr:BRO family protein [Halalkalibacter alkalisediminis]
MMKTFEKVFSFDGVNVRTVVVDEEVYFVAKDVCDVLDIKNTTQAIQKLDDDERAMFNIGRQGEANVVNEYGIYNLVFSSRKKEAKEFQRYVRHEILPSIRINGMYVDDDATSAQKLFNYNMLDETFMNCSIEKLADTYSDCIEYYTDNKVRLPYMKSRDNRRSDKKHTLADSKIMIMKKIQKVLEQREMEYKKKLTFEFVSVVSDVLKLIIEDIKETQHRKTRGKLSVLNKQLKEKDKEPVM